MSPTGGAPDEEPAWPARGPATCGRGEGVPKGDIRPTRRASVRGRPTNPGTVPWKTGTVPHAPTRRPPGRYFFRNFPSIIWFQVFPSCECSSLKVIFSGLSKT